AWRSAQTPLRGFAAASGSAGAENHARCLGQSDRHRAAGRRLDRDTEKWIPVFRKDNAQTEGHLGAPDMLSLSFAPWFVLTLRACQLGWEAQTVSALRMLRFASGDVRGQAELNRMVVEKIAAAAEAQVAAAAALMNGHKDHVVAGKALTVYK